MFRRATSDDFEFVNELEHVCFGRTAWSEALIAGAIEADQVTIAEGRGYLALRVVEEIADLERIAVAPSYRRAGHGRELLDEAVRLAAAAGADRLMLEVAADNAAALNLYAGAGFAEIDRRVGYYGYGVDGVVMSLPLS